MMSLSKLWIFLLTLVSGVLLLVFLLAPGHARRTLSQSATSRLELAQRSANFLLQNSARRWIDTAAQLASDAMLQSILEEVLRGQADLAILHDTAQRHLRKLRESLNVSFIILTDARGRVLCRVGQNEDEYKDTIDGYPLVSDAVRGYRLDDLWYQDDALYRMAAAPVIAAARDQYVGAVILGQKIGDELAQQVRTTLDVDAIFLCDGKVVASSRKMDKDLAAALATLAGDQQSQTAAGEVVPVPQHEQDLAVLSGLPGEAAARGAALVLLGPAPNSTSLHGLLSSLFEVIAYSDMGEEQLISLGFGLSGIFLAFLIGLLLLRRDAEGPYIRLLAEVRTLGRKGVQKVQDRRFSGPWRELALSINQAVRNLRPAQTEEADLAAEDRTEQGIGQGIGQAIAQGTGQEVGLGAGLGGSPPALSPAEQAQLASLAVGPTLPAPSGAQPLLRTDGLAAAGAAPNTALDTVPDRRTVSSLPVAKTFPASEPEPPSPSASTIPAEPFISPYNSAAQRALVAAVSQPVPEPASARPAVSPLPGKSEAAPPLRGPTPATGPATPGARPPTRRVPTAAGGVPIVRGEAERGPAATDSKSGIPVAPLGVPGTGRVAAPPPLPKRTSTAGPARAAEGAGPGGKAAPAQAPAKDAAPADSSRTLHDPVMELAEVPDSAPGFGESPPTVRDLPGSVVQTAIEQALLASPASYHGPIPARLRALANTGPISSAPPPLRAGGTATSGTALRIAPTGPAQPRNIFEETTAVNGAESKITPPGPAADQGESDAEQEAAFRQTYQEFIVTKQRCNEPVEGLTFEKFAVKLRQSRDQIIRQHNCKTVRFHVYIKDGKAALKATPVAR